MRRVQVQENRGPVEIIPQAQPIHSTVSSGQLPRRSDGAAIAQAFSDLSVGAARLFQQIEQGKIEDAEVAVQDRLNGMTFEEANDAVRSGQIAEQENPYFVAAFERQMVIEAGSKLKRNILEEYQTSFDRENGDLDQFLTDRFNGFQQEFGDLEFGKEVISDSIGGFFETLKDHHAEFKTGRIKETASNRFFSVARDTLQRAIATGQDPSAAVRSLYDDHKNHLGLSNAEMDQSVLQLAQEQAEEGNVEVVNSLLGTDITGTDGTKVGSFLTKPKTADKARRVIALAEAQRAENRRRGMVEGIAEFQTRAASGGLTEADEATILSLVDDEVLSIGQATSFFTQNRQAQRRAIVVANTQKAQAQYNLGVGRALAAGMGFMVQDRQYTDEDGRQHTFKAKAAIQASVDQAIGHLATTGATTEQQAATLAGFGVDAKFSVWENALSNGYLAIHQATVQAGENGDIELPPPATAGYEVWKSLGEFPALRERHISDATASSIYADAEVLERNGMDAQTALVVSAGIDRDKRRTGVSSRIDNDTLTSVVSRAAEGGWFDGTAENGGYISKAIERQARIYMDMGLPAERAMEEAQDRFLQSHTLVNGVMINTRNAFVPPNFDEVAQLVLEDFAEAHEEDVDDLTLFPARDGQKFWRVARKGSLVPHENWDQGGSFSINELQERFSNQQQVQADRTRQQVMDTQQENLAHTQEVLEGFVPGAQDEADTRAFLKLGPIHRRNMLVFEPGSEQYLKLQKKHGKEMYPDGGIHELGRRLLAEEEAAVTQ